MDVPIPNPPRLSPSEGSPPRLQAARGARYLGLSDVHEVVLVGERETVDAEGRAQSCGGLGAAVQLLQCQLIRGSPGKSL